MKELITDHPEVFAGWVAQKVGMLSSWGSCYALGIVDTEKKAIVGGVVFNNFNGSNATAHIALEPGIGRAMIALFEAVAHYAFVQFKLKRLTGLVDASNTKALNLDLHIGFEDEFTMKSAGSDGGDLRILVLWPDKCRWLRNGADK